MCACLHQDGFLVYYSRQYGKRRGGHGTAFYLSYLSKVGSCILSRCIYSTAGPLSRSTSLLFTEYFTAVSCRTRVCVCTSSAGILPEARLIDRICFGRKRVSFLINQREPKGTHTDRPDERALPCFA